MTYQTGDKVRIVDEFLPDSHNVDSMNKYLGTTVTIARGEIYYDTYRYWIDEDHGAFYWLEKTIAGYAYAITIEEFLASKENVCINCDNEEDAIALCSVLHKLGQKWADGDSYKGRTNWDVYQSSTCYGNDGCYGTVEWYKDHRYKIYKLSEVDIGERSLPENVMQALFRDTLKWRKIRYDATNNNLKDYSGNTIYEKNLFAIKNDERLNALRCFGCKEIISNTPEAIAEHLAKKGDCINCKRVRAHTTDIPVITYIKNEDGSYTQISKGGVMLSCSNKYTFSVVSIDDEGGKSDCIYKSCNEESVKPIETFFSKYPDAFDVIATVDSLGDAWTYSINDFSTYYYNYNGRIRLTANVNNNGAIMSFTYSYYDNIFNFVYSAKYDKIIWIDGDNYSETRNSQITDKNLSMITKIIKEIYKENK